MAIRKRVTALSNAERQRVIQAFLALKQEVSIIDGRSIYDRYVVIHYEAMNRLTLMVQDLGRRTNRNSAHRGPAFLPWHREFLYRLERDLQRVAGDQNLGLPYWDWTVDAPAVNQAASSGTGLPKLSIEDLAGPSGDPQQRFIVASGPFNPNNWPTVDNFGRAITLLRRTYAREAPVLPTQPEVNNALSITVYDSSPWNEEVQSFRNVLEGWFGGPQNLPGLHNLVHVWIGGSMLPGTSPNDPIFFLHHCNIDRIWAQWQARNPTGTYEPQIDGPCGHNFNDPMYPWDGVKSPDIVTPAAVWDYKTTRGYEYDPVPA